jgi:hypothetical protein
VRRYHFKDKDRYWCKHIVHAKYIKSTKTDTRAARKTNYNRQPNSSEDKQNRHPASTETDEHKHTFKTANQGTGTQPAQNTNQRRNITSTGTQPGAQKTERIPNQRRNPNKNSNNTCAETKPARRHHKLRNHSARQSDKRSDRTSSNTKRKPSERKIQSSTVLLPGKSVLHDLHESHSILYICPEE